MIDFREFDNEIFDLAKDRMSTILRGLAREEGVQGGQIGAWQSGSLPASHAMTRTSNNWNRPLPGPPQFFEQLHALDRQSP